jgi:hypothetical protein
VKDTLKEIYKKGTNIYQIIAVWKNEHKKELPKEILELVCKGFLKRMGKVPKNKHWIYLHQAFNNAWGQWNAKKQIDEAQVWKMGETMHPSIKEALLKSLGG